MVKNILINLMLCLGCCSHSFASISTLYTPEIEAVVFDCDGVLVDTEYLKYLAWQKALASIGLELFIDEYKTVAGHSSKKIYQMLQEIKKVPIPENIIHLRQVAYKELQAQGVPPIPEMVEFVQHLSKNKAMLGIELGLASSASRNEILFNLKQIGLEQAFDLIISGSDDLLGYHDCEGTNKPKPYIYMEVAKKLDVLPQRCLVFEDTQAGIEAAKGADMRAIAIPNWVTKGQDFSKADQVIRSITEFPVNLKDIPFRISSFMEPSI